MATLVERVAALAASIAAEIKSGRTAYPRLYPCISTDFLVAATPAPFAGSAVSSGTNTTVPSASALGGNHPGIALFRSSATANSGYRVQTDAGLIRLAGGEQFDCIFWLPLALTLNTIRLGFLDTTTSADATDGAYFEIPATGLVVAKTANNSTRTTSAALATLLPGTWYRARVKVNASATSVDFTVFSDAGSQIATTQIATNIPTASGRECGVGVVATNSGTTAADIIALDFVSVAWTKALARGAAT